MYDVIILGSGPAGLTAGIYAVRFGLKTAIVAGRTWGGQLMLTTDVENYPAFRSIQGPDLMQKMRDHVVDLGVEVIDKDFTSFESDKSPFVLKAEDRSFTAKAVIIATGADTRWLGIPGEERLRGKGVSSCAPCDAFFYKGKNVAVVGGGDSAMEETQVIAKVSPDVILIHRRDEWRAQAAMIDKVSGISHVRYLYNTEVKEMIGSQKLETLLLETHEISPKQGVKNLNELISQFNGKKREGNLWEIARDGVFIAIGLIPNTDLFKNLDMDSKGYIKRSQERDDNGVIKYFTKTNIAGIFTAGDVHDARYKQAVTAAAFGCMAAMDAQRWLEEQS